MLSGALLLAGALALQGTATIQPQAAPSPIALRQEPANPPVADPGPEPKPEPERAPAPAPEQSDTHERPLHDLFRNLGRDFLQLGSTDTLVVGGAGAALALVSHPADDNVNRSLIARGPAGYIEAGNVLGDGWTQAGAALGAYAVGLATDNPRFTHVGSDLIRGQVLNAVLTRGLKLAVDRDRPSGGPDSMPSGHTSATFTTAAVLHEHFGWKAGVAGYAAASFVGWSRLRDQHHWLTDIVIGSAIGLVAGRTVTAGHRDRQWTVVPVATHERVGVYVSLETDFFVALSPRARRLRN